MTGTDTDSGSDLVGIADVAAAFGVTVQTVRVWERDGKLVAIRTPGGHRRFKRSAIDALLRGVA
jgi:excisionase family DNA binding protein